jgi:F-type H+-transporting ATPase subunit epsilon
MTLLNLKIITPEKKVFEDQEIKSASFPTTMGEITILPGHIPLVTKLVAGEITIRTGQKEYLLVTTEGLLKLDKEGNIVVLSDYAIRSDEIEVAKVQEAKRRAEEAMKEKISERDFVIAEAELRRTLLELKVSQKRKNYNQPKV